MADGTSIEWTDASWNPVIGCSRVSEGCRSCYAERFVHRFAGEGQRWDGLTKSTPSGPRWTGEARLMPERLDQPLRWKRPRKIFVNSMSDLFHESLSNETIAAIFGVMAAASQHTFQVLTKRPKRMREWFKWHAELTGQDGEPWIPIMREAISVLPPRPRLCLQEDAIARAPGRDEPWPLPNVWLGVSVENQAAADERIPLLLETPAAVRFLSCEPLLGSVVLRDEWLFSGCESAPGPCPKHPAIDWCIAGGESGHGARPMHIDWARSLRDQCAAAGVPFFFKQWGEHAAWEGGFVHRVGKKAAGSLLDGVEHKAFPRSEVAHVG